jgi:uncharacterized protein
MTDITLNWPCIRLEGKPPHATTLLDISVSPNAKKTALVGWHDGALRIRLQAPPVDGAANEALRKWLAQQLGCPQSDLELLRGHTGRRKQWRARIPPHEIVAWLSKQALLKGDPQVGGSPPAER